MLFGIDGDDGARVSGWVRPDNPAALPAVIAAFDGGERVRLAATLPRQDRASEGPYGDRCGFVVDEATCASSRPGAGFSLFEAYGNTLLYRRATEPVAPLRLFHLDTEPRQSLAGELGPAFQLSYGSVELIGEETLSGILRQRAAPSVLIAGALLVRRIERELDEMGFRRSVLLRGPLRVLAAALLGLQELAREHGRSGGWRSLGSASLVARFAEADLGSAASLRTAFRRLSVEELRALADPTTRRLALTSPVQVLEEGHVGVALERLASFDVIGFDDEPARFGRALRALVGTQAAFGRVALQPARLREVEAALAECEPARALVELDQDLFASARQALDAAAR